MGAGALLWAVGKRSNRDYTWHTIPFPRVTVEGLAQRNQACVPGEPPLPMYVLSYILKLLTSWGCCWVMWRKQL